MPNDLVLTGANSDRLIPETMPVVPRLFAEAGKKASYRLIDFLCGTIRNRNTREAYARAIVRFCRYCEAKRVRLTDVNSLVVAAYIEQRCPDVSLPAAARQPAADPTVKQHLSAIKMLFDHLVTGHIVAVNPAAAVRGPRHVVTKGKTPVLEGPDAKQLLDNIDVRTLAGLRDRAIIGAMVYSFARVSALVGMNVRDYTQALAGRTMLLLLKEKNGKDHDVPVHHQAEAFLEAYVYRAGIGSDKNTPLFRTINRYGQITPRRMTRKDVWAMVKRRARQAGLSPAVCCHTFRATGITNYLLGGGQLEHAQAIAAHSSPRTTKLYDRTSDAVTLKEIERIDLSRR